MARAYSAVASAIASRSPSSRRASRAPSACRSATSPTRPCMADASARSWRSAPSAGGAPRGAAAPREGGRPGGALRDQQLSPDERSQPRLERDRIQAGDGGQAGQGETLAEDGGVGHQAPVGGVELVETGGDQRGQRPGHGPGG